jgi:pSer/pThr/pTyr-binding forkhead associated (FHA) protein
VAARHAELRREEDGLLLRDLGSESGTLLNGEPVSEAPLASGDEIRIGTCRFMLQAPGLRPERVLTAEVVEKRTRRWPRMVIWTTLAAAAGAVAVLKFKPEWLDLLRSML